MKEDFHPIPSNLFTYNKLTRTFSAEASDLCLYDFLQQSWVNPSARGFAMRSVKTGKEVPFYFCARLQDLEQFDGEVHGWRLVSDIRDTPNSDVYYCDIYND